MHRHSVPTDASPRGSALPTLRILRDARELLGVLTVLVGRRSASVRLGLAGELAPRVDPRRVKCTRLDGQADGAVRFAVVTTVREAALFCKLIDVGKSLPDSVGVDDMSDDDAPAPPDPPK